MPRLTPIHWKIFEKFILFVGCSFSREKGDHRVYSRDGLKRPIVIPRSGDLPVFIIRNNLRVLNISPDEYLEILKQL
ncbi:MAG: type II toxin-antitoxin system HicA family toxin [Candidatus Parcubacteria bacterium]|nr:type II toxin-antitoxin system HicA family toxin [Candidatus Parcubacteria bacterium]